MSKEKWSLQIGRQNDIDNRPKFYECGICSYYHSALWNGDCREDAARFTIEQLDQNFANLGWTEVEMPQ